MDLVSACPLKAASLVWQARPGTWVLTIACKATYRLEPGVSPLAAEQEHPNDDDNHWDDDPQRSLYAPSDLAPFKTRADVLLVGNAFAPDGRPVTSLTARLAVGEVDKAIAVHGDRFWTLDGRVREAGPFTRMSLRYERAAGGPDSANPVGVRPDAVNPHGEIAIPNLWPLGRLPQQRGEVVPPVAFGPIAATWPTRRDKLGPLARSFTLRALAEAAMPLDADPTFFNSAPRDQQLAELRSDERILLENLHPRAPRLVTSLPGHEPRVFVERRNTAPQALGLRADTLWIDTDRGLMTVTWRTQLSMTGAAEVGRVLVGMARTGERLTWSELVKQSEQGSLRGQSGGGRAAPSEIEADDAESLSDDDVREAGDSMIVSTIGAPAPLVGSGGVAGSSGVVGGGAGGGGRSGKGGDVAETVAGEDGASTLFLMDAPVGETLPFALVPDGGAADMFRKAEQAAAAISGQPSLPAGWMPPSPVGAAVRGGSVGAGAGAVAAPAAMGGAMDTAALAGGMVYPGVDAGQTVAFPLAFRAGGAAGVGAIVGGGAMGGAGVIGVGGVGAIGVGGVGAIGGGVIGVGGVGAIGGLDASASAGAGNEVPLPSPPPMVARAGWLDTAERPVARPEPVKEVAIASAIARATDAGANAARLGVLAMSAAAAGAHESLERDRRAAEDADALALADKTNDRVAESRSRPAEILKLLWFDPKIVPRLHKHPEWRILLAEMELRLLDDREDDDAQEDSRPKRSVFEVLSRGLPSPSDSLRRALSEAVDERGLFEPPLVLLSGELELAFDELEALRATVTVLTPLAPTDKKMKDALDAAAEFLKTPGADQFTRLAEGFTEKLREAFAQVRRSLPADYVESHTERALLRQRAYSMKTLYGKRWIRALLRGGGGGSGGGGAGGAGRGAIGGGGDGAVGRGEGGAGRGDAPPVYLPEALKDELPAYKRVRVKALGEVDLQEDQEEAAGWVVKVAALARVISGL